MNNLTLLEEFDEFMTFLLVDSWSREDRIRYRQFCKRLEHADQYMKEHNNG